nr:sulfotransferase domain-containing protein [Ornithinimicrobium sp. HY1793]
MVKVSVRKVAPTWAQRLGRSGYVALGSHTAEGRLAPDFLLVGGQRCGTTSLFRALMQHRRVVRPSFHKGVNYFDINYHRGPAWYAGHFPLRRTANRRVPPGTQPVVFEASGYYMFHPLALERAVRDLPDVKLVAMLRDPAERAFSAWKHETARGYETEPFMVALQREDERLAGERERLVAEPAYYSFAHRHHAYRSRGEYLDLLQPVTDMVPRSQLHIMYSEDFFAEPDREFAALAGFLEIATQEHMEFERFNARPSTSMPQEARDYLSDHFRTRRAPLEEFVGRVAPWPRVP